MLKERWQTAYRDIAILINTCGKNLPTCYAEVSWIIRSSTKKEIRNGVRVIIMLNTTYPAGLSICRLARCAFAEQSKDHISPQITNGLNIERERNCTTSRYCIRPVKIPYSRPWCLRAHVANQNRSLLITDKLITQYRNIDASTL